MRSGDTELSVSGTTKTVIKADFSKTPGKGLSATFSVDAEDCVLFDFAQGRKYDNGTYGYADYSVGANWTTNTTTPTVSNGVMTLSLNKTGDTELTAGKINLITSGEGRIGIRLKITGATGSSPKIYCTYKTDTWNEETLLCSLSQNCMEGELTTYSVDANLPDETITSLKLRFEGLSGGKAIIDYISIGSEPKNLYFGFEQDKASGNYTTGTYGGYDYYFNAWATNLSAKTGQYYCVEDGGLSIYVTDEYNGSAGTDNGIYVETTAVPGTYPWDP